MRLLFALVVASASLLLAGTGPARAQTPGAGAEILSDGPLTRIATTVDLNCQVAHVGSTAFAFFPGIEGPGACATVLSLDGALYAPAFVPSGGVHGV